MAAEENVRPGVMGRCKKHFPDRPGGRSRTCMAQGESQGACRGCKEQGIGSTGEGIIVFDSCQASTWTKRNKEEKEVRMPGSKLYVVNLSYSVNY